ncbi:hypothetical protein ACFVJH_09330 [Streptomyces decoyicus]|uniref:hypothetical protein n=1 Tax=Streptomyces decoyicus TaxID=249567 RepID=UPI0036434E6F
MSDSGDSGNSGYGDDGMSSRRSSSSSLPSASVLRRAMRWETFALVVFLVVLAAIAS